MMSSMDPGQLPGNTPLAFYRDRQHGFSLPYPEWWHAYDIPDGRLFSPAPSRRSTIRPRGARVPLDYLLKRLLFLVLIVWLAATINFFLPRLSGQDPIREKLYQQMLQGGFMAAGLQETTQEYERKFGL